MHYTWHILYRVVNYFHFVQPEPYCCRVLFQNNHCVMCGHVQLKLAKNVILQNKALSVYVGT